MADSLDACTINSFFRKWLRRLPHPFTSKERLAGYRYDLSILQAEFSLTQVWERGVHGRCFFEEVIRENIDLGRPEKVQLIFGRKLRQPTVAAGRCRTRIIQEGVQPSLHVYYKNTHIKQYHKEGRALRTETTINNSRDFGVGRLLKNLPLLRQIGFAANRRVLEVETVSYDCQVGAEVFEEMQHCIDVNGQHGSAMRFGDPRVQSLLAVIMRLALQLKGFRNRDLRPLIAQAMGVSEKNVTQGRMSYDLRRLRLHEIIERIPRSHAYRLTSKGLRVAAFYSQVYARVIRPGLSFITDERTTDNPLHRSLHRFQSELDTFIDARIAA